MQTQTARGEWRAYWTLPLAAMIGYSTIGLQSYGIGPFVGSLEQEFGWSRTDVMVGLSLSNFVGVFINIVIGMIVDRFGPRRVAITGLLVKTGSFAALGLATGTMLNWSLLWTLIAIGVVLVQSTVWTSAVASRFDHSRGMAMAVALSGSTITATFAPVLATLITQHYGWRMGFAGVAGVWLAITLPIVLLFFRGSRDDAKSAAQTLVTPPPELTGLTLREGIRTRAFFCLLVSFGAFAFYNMAIASNLMPLLGETGLSKMQAAGIASIMGLMGFASRLIVGFLLDRLPGNVIGFISQLLPVLGCMVFLMDSPSTLMLSIAVATFGIATGAEIDAALYLATRHFGLKSFAALFGAVITVGAVLAAIGPIVAGQLHDISGNYDGLLMTIMAVMTVGALAMLAIGRGEGPFGRRGH